MTKFYLEKKRAICNVKLDMSTSDIQFLTLFNERIDDFIDGIVADIDWNE